MMDEYIKKDDVLKLLNKNSITKAITFSDGISIYDSVKNLSTADVVPKSEVEEILKEVDSMIELVSAMIGLDIIAFGGKYAELKKKYSG